MNTCSKNARPKITLSIVSHGQGRLIDNLLRDIKEGLDVSYEIILTLNIPEDESFIKDNFTLPLRIIRNRTAKGFGANHNEAFAQSNGQYFAIVNPDIRAKPLSIRPLLNTLETQKAGACSPAVYSSNDHLQDSARRFPTVWKLTKRAVSHTRRLDYDMQESPFLVDWLAGMFIVFNREAYISVGGFDERYFMYYEDADICRRLSKGGWPIVFEPSSKIVHDAQHASHGNLRHMIWHIRSAFRFFILGNVCKNQ